MKNPHPSRSSIGRRPGAALVLAVLVGGSLAGCASQVDLSSIRREQRMLARRIADQKADIDRLNGEMSRLRNMLDDNRHSSGSSMGSASGYGQPPTGDSRDPYAAGTYPPDASGQTSHPGVPVAGARDYATGNDYADPNAASPGGGFAAPTAPPPPSGGGTSDLQGDMGRGSDSEYQQGLQSYSRGDYQRSVQSLRNYVSRNPRDPLVPVAQYWIGEAYFSQGKYNESILAFNEILVSWPESDRKPAALLRQADAFARTGDKIDARMILQKLMEDHPGSPEAAEAREQLRVLGG